MSARENTLPLTTLVHDCYIEPVLCNPRKGGGFNVLKRLTVLAQLALVALILILTAPLSHAAPTNSTDPIIREILRQHLTNSTKAGMPGVSWLAIDIVAAKALATGPESDINLAAHKNVVRRDPQASLLYSDTSYYWSIDHWEPEMRTTYTDTGDKRNTALYESWDGDSWVNTMMFTYSYDINGLLSTFLYQSWIADTWLDQFRYTYNHSGGLVTSSLTEQWNGSAWANLSQSIITYDANSRIETSTSQSWVGASWLDVNRTIYTYDGNGDLTVTLIQIWTGFEWINLNQNISTYDGNHRTTSSTSQTWNFALEIWENESRSEYAYDGSGNQILNLYLAWAGADWMVTDVDTLKYNGSNQNIQTIHLNFQSGKLSRDDYGYDAEGNLVLDVYSEWSGTEWMNVSRYVWVYTPSIAFLCGDANSSGQVNITDAVFLVNYIFAGGPPPIPLLAGDPNCSGVVNITDAVFLVNYIFAGGAAPCAACP